MKKCYSFRVNNRKDPKISQKVKKSQQFMEKQKLANFEHAKAKRSQMLDEKGGICRDVHPDHPSICE